MRRKRKKAPAQVKVGQWWIYAAGFATSVCLAGLAYAPALNGPFVFDDRYLPYDLPGFPASITAWVGGVRPLLMFSYWLNYLFGREPFGFHLVNLLLHILNSILAFFVIRSILRISDSKKPGNELVSACAAMVFLVHPLQTEAVAYVAGRSDCLSALFYFGAFDVFLYRPESGASWKTTLAVLLLFAAALATKEHTLTLAGLLLLTDYYWNPGFSPSGIRQNRRIYLTLMAAGIGGGIGVVRVMQTARSAGFSIKGFTWYCYFFTECRAFFVYLRLFLFPTAQNADWDFPVSRNILEHGAIFGLLAIMVLAAAAIRFRRRYPLASYSFLVYLLLMAPTSSFLPIQDPVAERRMYLPMIGLLLVAAAIVRSWVRLST